MTKENKKDIEEDKGKKGKGSEDEVNISAITDLISNEWVIIAFLFVLSLAIHIAFKSTGLFHFDSAYDTVMVERSVRDFSMHYSYGWGAPAMIVIVGFFYYLDHLITGTASAEGAYFLVTFLAAALTSVVIYLLVRRFSNKFVAFASSLFFSVAPLWLTSTVYPKTHSLAMLFSLLSGLLLLKATDKAGNKEGVSWKMLSLAGLSAGIAMCVRPIDGGFVLIPFLMLYLMPEMKNGKLVIKKERMKMRNAVAFLFPVFAVMLLLYAPKLIETGGISGFLKALSGETRGGWTGLINSQTAVSLSYITTTITYLGWAAAAGGILYLIKKRSIYLLGALVVWFSVFFFYIGNLAVVDSRFLIPAIAPLAILMAYGTYFVFEKNKIVGIAAVVIIAVAIFYTAYPLIEARHIYSGQKEFAQFVSLKTEPNALIYAGDNYIFIQRYGGRNTSIFGKNEESIKELNSNILSGRPVYMIDSAIPFMTSYEKDILGRFFIIDYIGEARNEIYQFSALNLRPYNERLFKITINETAVEEAVEAKKAKGAQ